jgi:hypothetical protein
VNLLPLLLLVAWWVSSGPLRRNKPQVYAGLSKDLEKFNEMLAVDTRSE